MINIKMMSSGEVATELGARLKRHRLALRMTQDEVAKRAGIFVGTVRNFEARPGASALDTVIRVALALGMADQFEHLFATRPKSIAQMEQAAEAPRQRARQSRRA